MHQNIHDLRSHLTSSAFSWYLVKACRLRNGRLGAVLRTVLSRHMMGFPEARR